MAKRGRKPISVDVGQRILQVYAETQSTRRTAAICGVGRSTVQNFIHDRHCKQTSQSVAVLLPGEVYVVPQRCRSCGSTVEVLTASGDCRGCVADRLAEAQRTIARLREVNQHVQATRALHEPGFKRVVRTAMGDIDGPTLAFELNDQEQARFEDVRRRRDQSGDASADSG